MILQGASCTIAARVAGTRGPYTTAVDGLVQCYTITWVFQRAFLKPFLWRILREFEIHCKTKTFRIASNILGTAMGALAVPPSNKCGAHEIFHDWSIHIYAATGVVPSVFRAFLWAFLWVFLERF